MGIYEYIDVNDIPGHIEDGRREPRVRAIGAKTKKEPKKKKKKKKKKRRTTNKPQNIVQANMNFLF